MVEDARMAKGKSVPENSSMPAVETKGKKRTRPSTKAGAKIAKRVKRAIMFSDTDVSEVSL